jgi:hypothetical protein
MKYPFGDDDGACDDDDNTKIMIFHATNVKSILCKLITITEKVGLEWQLMVP